MIFQGPERGERHSGREGVASHGCTGRISLSFTCIHGAGLVILLGTGAREVRSVALEELEGALLSHREEGLVTLHSLTPQSTAKFLWE